MSINTPFIGDQMSDDTDTTLPDEIKDINYTTEIRKKIINATFVNNAIPADELHAKLLMDSLTGIERSAVQRMRIKNDKDKGNQIGNLAVALAEYARTNTPNTPATDGPPREEPPGIPDDVLDQFDVPEHELSSNDNSLNYQEFKEANKE